MTTEQAAYLAGAIDGEGWIGLGRQAPNPDAWIKSPRYKFNITIANTNQEWLKTLQQWCGGSIYCTESSSPRNRRDCYSLRLRAQEARTLLANVMPFLLLKRKQAELLLEFFPLAARRRADNGNPSKGANPEIVAEQERIYLALRRLNQRGAEAVNAALGGKRSNRRCGFEGCERKHYGHGYCWPHYKKFIALGGPALHERSCSECQKPFIARRSDAEFCSKECAGKAYYKAHGERIRAQVSARKKTVVKT